VDREILQLLAGQNPNQAQDFILAFGEHRTASWADAQRQAVLRAASQRHTPHYRGQLRFQLGETAIVHAAQAARIGCIPIRTVKPGGVFMVARVGRFGLVSLMTPNKRAMPRKSVTRRLLSDPNEDIDPQQKLGLIDKAVRRGATELAYFGCMVAYPSYHDPAVPSQLAFAVPNAGMTRWIEWVPLTKLYASLQDIIAKDTPTSSPHAEPIRDRRFPVFRLPKQDRESGDEGMGG